MWYMTEGKRTSVYLTPDDLDRIKASGSPPLIALIRDGLASREQVAMNIPAQARVKKSGTSHRAQVTARHEPTCKCGVCRNK